MSYKLALEAAGATVFAFERFGSYQGDWLAKVEYNGRRGWVKDYYGSCSGCDAFQAEFGYADDYEEENGKFLINRREVTKEEYDAEYTPYRLRLIQFGDRYLMNIISQQEVEKYVAENSEWDLEADEMMKFVKKNSI
jgi:hypothetical protein